MLALVPSDASTFGRGANLQVEKETKKKKNSLQVTRFQRKANLLRALTLRSRRGATVKNNDGD